MALGGQVLQSPASAGSTDETTEFHLGEIVVTTARIDRETPTTIVEVSADDIARLGAHDVAEALEMVPGVHLRQARSKNEYYITLRGFEQENVLILLDGVPIYVPYEGVVNLRDIPVENIHKIKVIKGNVSSLYGANALGGAINIITKKGGARPTLGVTYEGSDYERHHVSVSHGWRVGKLSYFATAVHREAAATRLAEDWALPAQILTSMESSPANPPEVPNRPIDADTGGRDNSDYERDAITLTSMLDLNGGHSIGLSYAYYKNEYGIPPVPIYRDHKRGFFWFPRYWRFSYWERHTVNLVGETRLSPALRLKLRVFQDAYENTLDAYDNATYTTQERIGPPSGSSLFDDMNTGGNAHIFWNGIEGNELRLGVTYKQDRHEEQFLDGPMDKLVSATWSLGIEDEYALSEHLGATLGGSYDIFQKKERKQEDDPDGELGADVKVFNPHIGLRYVPGARGDLHFSVARKSRFPTMRNLYATGVIGPQGNPDLDEEKTINVELGGGLQITDGIRGEAAVFYSDARDLINFDNLIGRFEQYSEARIVGVELGASGRPAQGLRVLAHVTFLQATAHGEVTIENEWHDTLVYTPDELPYRPQQRIDLDATWSPSFGLTVNLHGSYIGNQCFYDHFDADDNMKLVAVKRPLDGYALFNGRISQAIGQKVTIFLVGENLLNGEYQDIYLFPGSGMTLWGGVNLAL